MSWTPGNSPQTSHGSASEGRVNRSLSHEPLSSSSERPDCRLRRSRSTRASAKVPQHALEINLQSLKLRAVGVSLQTHEKSAPATNQDVVVSHVEPPFNVPQRGTFDEFNEKRASPQALRLSLPSALYLQYEALNT